MKLCKIVITEINVETKDINSGQLMVQDYLDNDMLWRFFWSVLRLFHLLLNHTCRSTLPNTYMGKFLVEWILVCTVCNVG